MQITKTFKALSDSNRVRALCALREQELCGCQIIELLKLAPSTVFKHMSVLINAGLVTSIKKGRWVYYRLTDQDQTQEGQLLRPLPELTSSDVQLGSDRAALRKILALDPEELCRIQSER